MIDSVTKTFRKFYALWCDAVEHRIKTEQYFVATVYTMSVVFGAFTILVLLAFAIIEYLGDVVYFTIAGIIVFALAYRGIKEYGKGIQDDDDEPPIGI